MVDAFGLLGMLLLWLAGGKGSAAPAPARPGAPPQLPPAPASTPPWPQVTPTGLPPFPGSGWEYDEPPPAAVKQRAAALVAQLWKAGSGTHKIEQTAGRWIAYRAELLRGGTKGVVAYRQATKRPVPAPAAPRAPAAGTGTYPPFVPAPAPPYVPYTPPGVAPRVVTSPGQPQPAGQPAAPRVPPAVATPVSMPVPPASVLALPTLRQGDGIKPKPPNPNVRIVQQKLGIKDDGQFGSGTKASVVVFQRKVGLSPDGVVGPKTWTALFAIR